MQTIATRALWSYFLDSSQMDYPDFYRRLRKRFPNKNTVPELSTVIALIERHFSERVGHSGDLHVLLLVDELSNCAKGLEHNEREKRLRTSLSELCEAMDTHVSTTLHIVATDLYLRPPTAQTESGRKLNWIQLRALNSNEITSVFHNKLQQHEKSGTLNFYSLLAELCSSGLPRVLEHFKFVISERYNRETLHEHDYKELMEVVFRRANLIPLSYEATAIGLVNESFSPETIIRQERLLSRVESLSNLVAHAVFLRSSANGNVIVPEVTVLGLHTMITISTTQEDLANSYIHTSNLSYIRVNLRLLLQEILHVQSQITYCEEPSVARGLKYEKFHANFELCKLNARAIVLDAVNDSPLAAAWNIIRRAGCPRARYITGSIADLYQLSENQSSDWLILGKNKKLGTDRNEYLMEKLQWRLFWTPVHLRTSHSDHFSELLKGVKAKACGVFCLGESFPAMDLVIVVKSVTTKSVWCLLLEMKYEGKTNYPSVTRADLDHKLAVLNKYDWVKRLKTEGEAERVIMVFVLWRHRIAELRDETLPSYVNQPDAILLIGQEQLNKFYASLRPNAFNVPSSLRSKSGCELHIYIRVFTILQYLDTIFSYSEH